MTIENKRMVINIIAVFVSDKDQPMIFLGDEVGGFIYLITKEKLQTCTYAARRLGMDWGYILSRGAFGVSS